jgi:hypothetical protein
MLKSSVMADILRTIARFDLVSPGFGRSAAEMMYLIVAA